MSDARAPLELVDVDLAERLGTVSTRTEARGARIVFWWRHVPLGHTTVGAGELPISPARLADIAARVVRPAVAAVLPGADARGPLPELPQASEAGPQPDLRTLVELESPLGCIRSTQPALEPTLSVVICTRDRAQHLRRCLQALSECSPQPDEIIVVDNAPSNDETRSLVEPLVDVRYVLQPQPGLDRARNAGIVEARSELIAFADDDVTVHPGWVGEIRSCFHDRDVMAVTGLLLPAELDTEAQLLFEEHWSFGRGYQAIRYDGAYFQKLRSRGVPAWYVGAGASMAFRRDALERVGLFDELLDVGAAGCSGDSEMWYRLLASGAVCLYSPRVVAFHRHRRELSELSRQLHHYMRGHTAALCIQFARHRHGGILVRLCVLLPLYYVRVLAAALKRGFGARYQFLWAELTGAVSGVVYFLRNGSAWKASCPRLSSDVVSGRRGQRI